MSDKIDLDKESPLENNVKYESLGKKIMGKFDSFMGKMLGDVPRSEKLLVAGLASLVIGGMATLPIGCYNDARHAKKYCRDSQEQVVATVTEELHPEGNYVVRASIDNDNSVLVRIIDGNGVTSAIKDQEIRPGSTISFPKGNLVDGKLLMGNGGRNYKDLGTFMYEIHPEETYFTPETKSGTKRADRVHVL